MTSLTFKQVVQQALADIGVSEILGLHWSDLKGKRLLLQDSKTGPRTVWLSEEARAVFLSIPRIGKNPWIFWNPR